MVHAIAATPEIIIGNCIIPVLRKLYSKAANAPVEGNLSNVSNPLYNAACSNASSNTCIPVNSSTIIHLQTHNTK